MEKWKLQELRELIEKHHGSDQLRKAAPHINSVDWKIRAASYHSYAASGAFSDLLSEQTQPPAVFKMMFSNGEEASNFREARFVYETNVIACAQSMHSASDIISHVIVDSLALNDVDEENLCLRAAQKLVPESKLKETITRVLGLVSFRYLQDFVNTSKHVQLVDSQYTLDLTGNEDIPHGVKFKAFECKGRTHPTKWGDDLLKEMRQLSIEYVQIGSSINEYMLLGES